MYYIDKMNNNACGYEEERSILLQALFTY